MKVTKTENFIRTYDDVLPDKLVKHLIQLAEQSVTWNPRSQGQRKDNQIELGAYWTRECQEVNNNLLEKAFSPYIDDFSYLQDQGTEWCSGSILFQKTEPLEGYHAFHCENTSWAYRHRVLAWMIYLNDVEEGGETEWLYQQLKIKPRRNIAVIWPGSFTHLHRGNPPISGTKYILTGWFTPTSMMSKFNIEQNTN
jgi:hypothetical protein